MKRLIRVSIAAGLFYSLYRIGKQHEKLKMIRLVEEQIKATVMDAVMDDKLPSEEYYAIVAEQKEFLRIITEEH